MNAFWWGRNKAEKSGICWTSWNSLCQRKADGGLVFRKLLEFNLALLTKQTNLAATYKTRIIVVANSQSKILPKSAVDGGKARPKPKFHLEEYA